MFLKILKMSAAPLILVFLCFNGFSACRYSSFNLNSTHTYPLPERSTARGIASRFHKVDTDNEAREKQLPKTELDTRGDESVHLLDDYPYDSNGRRRYLSGALRTKNPIPRDFSLYKMKQTLDIDGDGKEEKFIIFESGSSASRVFHEVEIIDQKGKNILFSRLEQGMPIIFSDREFVRIVPDFQRKNRYMIVRASVRGHYRPTDWGIQVFRYNDTTRSFHLHSDFNTKRKFDYPYDGRIPSERRRQIEDEVLEYGIGKLR